MEGLIRKLDWDSSFFGYKIGKIVIDKEELDKERFKEEAKAYELVYVYTNKIIDDEKFKLVDEKVTFYQKINNNNFSFLKKSIIRPFNLEQDDLNNLIKLGLESGVYSRFKIDSNFSNNEFERLYKEWIINSVNYKLSFEVLIAVNEYDKMLGFITVGELNKNTSEIGLIAVSRKARGKGLARELVNSAIDKSIKRGYEKMEVVTQKENIPAINLYTKTSFEEKEIINIYHYWNS